MGRLGVGLGRLGVALGSHNTANAVHNKKFVACPSGGENIGHPGDQEFVFLLLVSVAMTPIRSIIFFSFECQGQAHSEV